MNINDLVHVNIHVYFMKCRIHTKKVFDCFWFVCAIIKVFFPFLFFFFQFTSISASMSDATASFLLVSFFQWKSSF